MVVYKALDVKYPYNNSGFKFSYFREKAYLY